ncbi:hypothetical protein R3W88_026675 [Solanum pinnatisectum]|uniref:Uncharacterized protein n=1 Tax=Solanum pinnatisectum TaxID=50273 RepID=A0AAV9LDX3_9SOLN|nr:hypothetical protein R3W88_026675 [Solanum pinnatisectum]
MMNTPTDDLLTKILDKMEGSDMTFQETKSDFVEEKMGQLTYFVYANPYDNSMTHVNENKKSAIQVSAIVTSSGKYLQEITRPDNVDAQGGGFQ